MATKLETVQSGALGQFYPVSLSYTKDDVMYLLIENDDGEYQITTIDSKNGNIDVTFPIKGVFDSYYDFMQIAYDEDGSASRIFGISIEGKSLEIFKISTNGKLNLEHTEVYDLESRKSLTFYVLDDVLHYYRQDEDSSTGKFTVKAYK